MEPTGQIGNIDNILVVMNVYFEMNKLWGCQDLIKQPGLEPYVYIWISVVNGTFNMARNYIWTSRIWAGTNVDIQQALIGPMASTPQTKFNI